MELCAAGVRSRACSTPDGRLDGGAVLEIVWE